MDFPDKLAALRNKKDFTQQTLADTIGCHVIQVSRYESGSSQSTLDVIRKLARALNVSADELIFDKDGRGSDKDLRLQFEAIANFSTEEKKVVKAVLDALILRHEASRWASNSPSSKSSKR